jgi:hypothetical protein
MITQERLKELFDYQDGNLVWKINRGRLAKAGQVAGNFDEKLGYIRVGMSRKSYLLHRVIFMYHHGYLPEFLDHINGDRVDNRIENLRPATKDENCRNRCSHKNNTSGEKNVSWHIGKKKWGVSLHVNGAKRHFGDYEDLELAALVAAEARDKFHGAFARHF